MTTTQKTAKPRTSTLIDVFLAMAICLGATFQVSATVWTGASPTASQLWSDPINWDTLLAPTASDPIILTNSGSSEVLGAVNNIVSADTTVASLFYRAKVSFITPATNYHTTLINPGVTLNIEQTTGNGAMLYVGDWDLASQDNQYYYTVKGPGASLVVGNFTSPMTNQGLQVTATYRSATNHVGSLDLSGLDNFSLAGGYFWVGINGTSEIPYDRPAGRVFLAKTNLVIMAGDFYDAQSLGSFRVGESRGNTPNQASLLELGHENAFYTPWLKIGGARTGNSALNGGFMYFRPGLVNPTLKLRGTDGTSRLGAVRIGDNSWSTSGSSIPSKGVVDLTGGTVDALVHTMFVGMGPGGNNTTAAGASAGANGTLTWTSGTFDMLFLSVGYQYGNNLSTNTGTINVRSPDAKLIVDRFTLGRDAGANAGGGIGLLNIDGGVVEIKGLLSELGSNARSTIVLTNGGMLNLQPEGDATPTTAIVDTLSYSSGTVTNGILAITNLNVLPPSTAFTVYSGTTLDAGSEGTPANLAVDGGLALKGGTLAFDIADSSSLDQISVAGNLDLSGGAFLDINLLNAVGAGTYPLMTYGSLDGSSGNLIVKGPIADSRYTVAFDTSAPNVSMNVGGAAGSLLWSGGNNGNTWDLKVTTNWNNGTESFYSYDAVEFSDSGSANPAINLVGALYPGSTMFSAGAKDYILAGSGKISGIGNLTLNGGSTLTVLTTNDYKGSTDINAGTLAVGNGSTADGSLGSGTVNNSANLVFNPAAVQTNVAIIAGAGNVIKRGPGVTRLSGASTFTGPLTVEQGILQAGSASALGDISGMATINNGATLDVSGQALGAKPVTVSGAGVNAAGAIINSGASQANALRDVQLAGDTTFGGDGSWSISSASAASTDPGLTAYGYKLTKLGANQVAILCLRATPWNLDLGEVDVREGCLSLQGNLYLGSLESQPITVRSNATLVLINYGGVTLTKAFSLEDGSCFHGRGTNSAVSGSVTVQGKVTFDTLNGATNLIDCAVAGNGSVIKGIGNHPAAGASTGAGTLVLSGANTFSGDLRIETGTVSLTGSATLACPNIDLAGGSLSVSNRSDSTLALNNGQTLKGAGNLIGLISAPTGSTVAPALTNGLLGVSGDLTLRGTTRMDLNRTGGQIRNSRINVSGTLDCGGSLVLTSSGEALQAGDTFTLFQAPTTLNPFANSAITWPTLGGGLYWTNRLAVDGTIAVASTEPVTPPALTYSVSAAGDSLSVSWPLAYTSYVLQAQTNAPGVGLTSTWTTVSTVGNQFVQPIIKENGSVFLRLLKP